MVDVDSARTKKTKPINAEMIYAKVKYFSDAIAIPLFVENVSPNLCDFL